MLPYLTGEVKESPREAFLYASDDGGVMALRVGDYKMTFEEQRATTMRAWAEPFVKLRLPYICNLRRDPFERAEFNSNTYLDWMVDHVPMIYLAQAVIGAQLENFIKYPPRQKAASFNLDTVMQSLGPKQAAYAAQKAKAAAQAGGNGASSTKEKPELVTK
jgi:arylsulfatase